MRNDVRGEASGVRGQNRNEASGIYHLTPYVLRLTKKL